MTITLRAGVLNSGIQQNGTEFLTVDTSNNATLSNNLTVNGNTILGDATTDTLNVGNGGLVKDASGNVGIGTASPTTKLQVQKNGKSFQLWDASTNDGAYMVYAGASTTKNWCIGNQFNVSGALEFTQTSASGGTTIGTTPSMVIDSSGNVGIGTASPAAPLDVSRTAISANTPAMLINSYTTTSVPTGTATTVYTLPSSGHVKYFQVFIGPGAGTADTTNYAAYAIIAADSTARLMTVVQGGMLTISLSGLNIRITQGSGTTWSACRCSVIQIIA